MGKVVQSCHEMASHAILITTSKGETFTNLTKNEKSDGFLEVKLFYHYQTLFDNV